MAKLINERIGRLNWELENLAISANGRDWEVYTSLPGGWIRVQGATTAPRGYGLITNREPRWLKNGKLNPDRKTALLQLRPASECDSKEQEKMAKVNVEQVRKQYPAGTRVKLVQMDDVQAPPVGTMGTVTAVDDTGSLLMHWDNGSRLNVVYGEDVVRKVSDYV